MEELYAFIMQYALSSTVLSLRTLYSAPCMDSDVMYQNSLEIILHQNNGEILSSMSTPINQDFTIYHDDVVFVILYSMR